MRLIDVCSRCGAQIEDDLVPCCPDAGVLQVAVLPARQFLGVSRPPVLGPVTVSAPTDETVRQVLQAVEDRSGGHETPRHDRILRAVCERLLVHCIGHDAWLALDAADYERVMAMSDVELRAHVAAHLRGAQAQLARAS